MGAEVKELKREAKEDARIPLEQIPANIRMPEQLTEQELRTEVERLRMVLRQVDQKLKEQSTGLSIKRIEFLFAILAEKGFGETIDSLVRKQICDELGIFENENKEE